MLRSTLTLISAVLAVSLAGDSRAAVTVFQDPACSLPCTAGTPGALPAPIGVGGADVTLNLFYVGGTLASASDPCHLGTGGGEETCGYDIHIATTNPGVVIESFTPDPPPSDIVYAITGNVLRLNGGNPVLGELGIHRLGTVVVSATAPGSVVVTGNLSVTSQLTSLAVPSGITLAVATGEEDTDLDGVPDSADNCPTVANPGQEDGGGGLEVPPDGVGDACDNCVNVNNPRVASDYLTTAPWATLTGGQRDDDHDGYGNKCDAKFTGTPNLAVGGLDLGQFRTSSGEDRRGDTCGTTGGTRPCAIFDLDENAPTGGHTIGGLDLGRFRALSGSPPGPRCAECTGTGSVLLPCTAGTAGDCN